MPGLVKSYWRAVSLAALAVLVLMAPGTTTIVGRTNGRNVAECRQVCNDIKAVCADECPKDCDVLYPSGSPDYDACIRACKLICANDSQLCKEKCTPHVTSTAEP